MSIYHKHHIIPRHMGGTDDSINLIELTVEEHAEAHRILWELHGKWQDRIAWQTLSGQINKAQAIREIARMANIGNKNASGINHRGGKPKGWITPEHVKEKQRISRLMSQKPQPRLGKKHKKETKDAHSQRMKNRTFITNGIITKLVIIYGPLPKGWRYGMK